MRKLLLIMVYLYATTEILQARVDPNNPPPPTPVYPEYKTAVHSTCANVKFGSFNIDKASNYVYAIGASGNLPYVYNVYSINRAGTCRKLGRISETGYMAIDAKRKYGYVEANHKLIQFNIGTGKLVRRITVPYLHYRCRIETDKYGNIYTLNPDKALIHKVSPTGSLLLTFGGKGSYDGKFNNPQALAIDKNNYIYVVDSENYRIQKFNSAGHFVAKWGSSASDVNDIGPYEFQFPPIAIGVDANSNVYVADKDIDQNSIIKKYHSNDDYIGTYRVKVSGFRYENFKTDGYGNSYELDYTGTIIKINKYGQLIDAWGGNYVGYSKGAHQILTDMVFDRQNNMYTFDYAKSLIQKFSKYGSYIRKWGGYGGRNPLETESASQGEFSGGNTSMAINNLDEIYTTAVYNRVYRFNRDGRLLQTLSFPLEDGTLRKTTHSVSIDKYNNVYVLMRYVPSYDADKAFYYINVYNRYFKKIRKIEIMMADNRYSNAHGPYSLNIDKNRNLLYVGIKSSVRKYTLSGQLLTGWNVGSVGSQTLLRNGSLAYIDKDKLNIYSNSGTLLKSEKLPTGTKFVKEDKFGNRYFATDRKIYKKSVNPDIDHDGVPNERDAFPFNKREWLDTDHDGIGNNADKDDDNDGLLDTVEKAHKLNPLNASDATADFDHDGFTNAQEINAGTNIRSAKSHPTWVPIIMGDIVTFTLPKR